MDKRKFCAQFRKDLSLIYCERKAIFLEAIGDWWGLKVTRARVWKAWKDFDEHQEQLPDHHILCAGHVAEYENYLMMLETRRLHKLARKYHVTLPEMEIGEFYQRLEWDTDTTEPYYFTEKGFVEAYPKVEDAFRKRREKYSYWFGIAMGLAAAITGLISVLK